MISKFFTIIILINLFYIFPLFSQELNNKTVATIGTKTITEREFLERYELSPGLNRNKKSETESSKLEFLYTLIAEKLFAQESAALGLSTLEVLKFSKEEFLKMFVRDALYKKEISDKIQITPLELQVGYNRNANNLEVNFIYSEDEDEIIKIYRMLVQGIEFDSILYIRPEFDEQKKPVEVLYGQMEDAVEDSLYKLNIGEFTSPILTPDGWYIFRLTNKIEQLLNASEDLEQVNHTVEKIIRARKSRYLYKIFYTNFFKDKKVDVNPVLFESLAEKISNRLSWKKKNYRISENDLFNILAEDVVAIENEFGIDSLKQIFAEFDSDPLTLKQFFRILVFDGFLSEEYDIRFIRKLLDTKTRTIIERELLAREGIKRGYQLLPEVQADVNMWVDNYHFQMVQNKLLDSVNVSEDEIYFYYKTINKGEYYPQLVNIVEILTDSLDIVDIILQEIKNGKVFSALAKKYSKREWTKKKGGEFGFFPSSQFGEIGKIAATLKVGEIYGPLKVPGGYSIFKLIDKRDSVIVPPQPFDKVKEEYRRSLRYLKVKSKMDNYAADLAIKYGVGIDFNILESIEVTNISSFALRRLGFGSKITAVPILAPNAEWVEPWIEKMKVIQ